MLCWLGQHLWEAVTAIATVAAALVVWQQLSGLREQLRIQSDQLKLQHYAEYTRRYQAISLGFPEDINNPDFKLVKKRRDYASVMRQMRAYFDLCFEEWDLHRRKLIDKEAWGVWEDGIKTAMSKTAFQQAWQIIMNTGTDYGPDFQKFIERIMVAKQE